MAADKRAFGESLREWRTGASMTLRDLADDLGKRGYTYTTQAISAWERGESAPPAHVVRAIEARFGIAQGTLGIHLGHPAGDPLSERLEMIESRQAHQEAALIELRDELRELLQLLRPGAGPRQRARR